MLINLKDINLEIRKELNIQSGLLTILNKIQKITGQHENKYKLQEKLKGLFRSDRMKYGDRHKIINIRALISSWKSAWNIKKKPYKSLWTPLILCRIFQYNYMKKAARDKVWTLKRCEHLRAQMVLK